MTEQPRCSATEPHLPHRYDIDWLSPEMTGGGWIANSWRYCVGVAKQPNDTEETT